MKKIEFGFSNDIEPTGSWEGMGIKEGLLLTDADYYGSVEYEGNYYIVAKVVSDPYNRYPELLDKFIVRQALCDLYADGSATMLLNQEETSVTKLLEKHLNSPQIINNISNINDVINVSTGLHKSPKSFILGELYDTISVTSITPEAFDIKNNAINSCHRSFSNIGQELNDNYTK